MLNPKTDFQTIAHFGQAAGWVKVGTREVWVSLLATSEGRGQKREWFVTASHYQAVGPVLRAEATVACGYRYEAANLAIAGLVEHLSQQAA